MLKKVVLHLLVALTLSMVFAWCWIWIFHVRSVGRVVHSWEQPKEIDYKSFGPYSLFVRERAPYWNVLGGRRSQHEIIIGHDDSYGHWFDCTFHAGSLDDDEIDAYIKRSTVEWTVDGVSIKQESAHVIHFPKKTFIGGR